MAGKTITQTENAAVALAAEPGDNGEVVGGLKPEWSQERERTCEKIRKHLLYVPEFNKEVLGVLLAEVNKRLQKEMVMTACAGRIADIYHRLDAMTRTYIGILDELTSLDGFNISFGGELADELRQETKRSIDEVRDAAADSGDEDMQFLCDAYKLAVVINEES